MRLIAVKRPGWLQIFRFEATARVRPPEDDGAEDTANPEAEYRDLFGLIREDARSDQQSIRVFENDVERRELFSRWSEDLICLRGAHGLSN